MTASITTRLASMGFAVVMTVVMLAGIDTLATSPAPDALLARVAATPSV